MDKGTDRKVKEFVAKVAEQYSITSAYLFGSYAKNLQRAESDIDVALVIDGLHESDKFDVQVQLMLIASRFDSRIEPHPISKQEFLFGNPFVKEITNTGKLIRT